MRRYSAGEAIGPAWEHTKTLLWRDTGISGDDGFRNGGVRSWTRGNWGRLLKICLVALVCEGSGFNAGGRLPSRLGRAGGWHPGLQFHPPVALMFVLIVVTLAIVLTIAYLRSRLQLAFFDMVLLRDPFVAPAWRRHNHQAWRWFGLKTSLATAVVLVLSPLLLPTLPVIAATLRDSASNAHNLNLQWTAIVGTVLEIVVLVFAALVAIRFVTTLVLPGLAMEDLDFGAALRRGWQIFRADVSGMLLFAILQPLFLFVLGMAISFGMIFAIAALALPFGLVGLLLWFVLHASLAGKIILGIFAAVSILLLLAFGTLLYIAVTGTVLTFSRAWSLFFLGGRYPLLGQYLEPGAAVPVWTPPPSFPHDGSDGGPDFPADPALA